MALYLSNITLLLHKEESKKARKKKIHLKVAIQGRISDFSKETQEPCRTQRPKLTTESINPSDNGDPGPTARSKPKHKHNIQILMEYNNMSYTEK